MSRILAACPRTPFAPSTRECGSGLYKEQLIDLCIQVCRFLLHLDRSKLSNDAVLLVESSSSGADPRLGHYCLGVIYDLPKAPNISVSLLIASAEILLEAEVLKGEARRNKQRLAQRKRYRDSRQQVRSISVNSQSSAKSSSNASGTKRHRQQEKDKVAQSLGKFFRQSSSAYVAILTI